MIFLLYLVFPIVEIYLLFQAGDEFGFWPIFGWVVLTAWLGLRLVKFKGFHLLAQVQMRMMQGQDPQRDVLEGVAVMIGGVLLMVPGFITDALAILCLFPPTRRLVGALLLRWLKSKVQKGRVHVFTGFGGTAPPHDPFSRPMKDVTPEAPKELDQQKPY